MPRWLHQLFAFVCGYFWLSCPRCGQMFGGHEVRFDPSLIRHVMPETRMTCRDCQHEGAYEFPAGPILALRVAHP